MTQQPIQAFVEVGKNVRIPLTLIHDSEKHLFKLTNIQDTIIAHNNICRMPNSPNFNDRGQFIYAGYYGDCDSSTCIWLRDVLRYPNEDHILNIIDCSGAGVGMFMCRPITKFPLSHHNITGQTMFIYTIQSYT